jgi:hypothetical protein
VAVDIFQSERLEGRASVSFPVSGQVILEVWDLSPKTPVLRPPDIMATEGRGLRIVEELSVNFGCNRKGRWKVVWALLGAG